MSRIRFKPHEYRELSDAERDLLAEGYQRALETIRKNITEKGFSACSLEDNDVHGTDVNYRSVWARDGALTTIYTLDLDEEDEPDIRLCQRQTLATLWRHQSPTGQVPANVRIDTDEPEYAGVGGIASIDSVMWTIMASVQYAIRTGDWAFIHEHRSQIDKSVYWLEAHDSNNCGMLEIPEASDWADLFGYSFHVLYDEVLWYRSLVWYARMLKELGEGERATAYQQRAAEICRVIVNNFWPTTAVEDGRVDASFTQTQYSLGDARYLVAQTSPFSFSWRCDVYGNVLAYLTNMIDKRRATQTFRFLWGVGANEPAPVKNLYPPVQAGDPEWKSYYTVNLLNLPDHYHNGGIWPFIGGMWVRYIYKLGMPALARRELVKLALLCKEGLEQPWEFNEWHHGHTGRPMGKRYQAWSAASFIRACHDLSVDPESMDHIV